MSQSEVLPSKRTRGGTEVTSGSRDDRDLSKLTGKARSRANLTPFPPGNNANPTGRNQYTVAKERFQEYITKHLNETSSKSKGLSRGEALALAVLEDALAGDALSRSESLKRLWPVVAKVEADLRGQLEERAVASNVSLDNLSAEEKDTLKRLMHKAIIKPIDKERTDE